jgi:hypothetical protein
MQTTQNRAYSFHKRRQKKQSQQKKTKTTQKTPEPRTSGVTKSDVSTQKDNRPSFPRPL